MSDSSGGSTSGPASGGSSSPPLRGKAVYDAEAEGIVDFIEGRRHPETEAFLEGESRGYRPVLDHTLPQLRLPGFGEPEDDCGEYLASTVRFCGQSGKTHQFKHNCLRYDCPQHAPYAIRRRAAGSADAAGLAPTLKSMILRFWKARGETDHHYHHLFISPPDDFFFRSKNPLAKGKEIVREIMDELGIQGVQIYHPYRGNDEDRFGDDRGFWRDLLFHKSDWDAARDELEFSPHFHVVGVAPYVDISVTEEIEDKTGWVIHRRQDDQGRSIVRDPSKGEENDDDAMTRVLTYALSHAGVYSVGEQRRLAAWLKGPDVPTTDVYPKIKKMIGPKVMASAEDTLGIASPSLECDCDYHRYVAPGEEPTVDHVRNVESGAVSIDSWPWPDGPDGSTELPLENRTELPADRVDDLPPSGSSSSSTSSSSWTVPEDSFREDDVDGQDDDVDEDVPDCGSYLRHISQAGDYILDREWREQAPYADELDTAYRDYISYMTNKDVGPLDDLPSPEEERELREQLPRLPEEGDDDVDPPIPPPSD